MKRQIHYMAAAALATASLQAGTLTLTSVDTTRGGSTTILQGDGTTRNVWAGAIVATFDGQSATPLFCVDLYTSIGYGSWGSTVTGAGSTREQRVEWLYANQVNTVNSVTSGIAFQLSIWDIIHDGGDGLEAGNIRASSAMSADLTGVWANYLAVSLGQTLDTGAYFYRNVSLATGAPAQNLIGRPLSSFTVSGPGSPVPEPSTYVMLSAGLGLVLFGRRKRPATQR